MLIVEYCAGGNLLQYLRNKRQDVDNPLTVPLEMDMALQVSRGMSYLASQKVIYMHPLALIFIYCHIC